MKPHNSKRGQATIIGGVMFLIIAVLLTSFLYEVFSVQSKMNLFDALRSSERIQISKVFFGAKAIYDIPNTTNVYTASTSFFNTSPNPDPYAVLTSKYTNATIHPLVNGDFSKDSSGWFFTRSYIGANKGASGAYTTDVIGSESGAGAVYMDFMYNPPSGLATAIMNWTTNVYFDLESIGGKTAVTNITLSFGRYCSIYNNVERSHLSIYIIDPLGSEHKIKSYELLDVDSNWIKENDILITNLINTTGWYKLIFSLNVTVKSSALVMPELKLYLDDVDIEVNFINHLIDWSFTFYLNQEPPVIEELKMALTTRYNKTIIQTIYILDQSSNNFIKISSATISNVDVKLEFTFTGSDIQYYVSPTNRAITFRIYSVSNKPFEIISASPNIATFYTGVTNKMVIYLYNPGGIPVRVISLWIIDYTGHTHLDIDIQISPGETYTYVVNRTWTAGEYIFKVITSRGTIAIYKTTAH